ncbi:hypothetical protein VTP01DRAFT_8509 [Rhizomucor pusillus]|uniref:uncharacterized protein n=1 Tax=Rhizomucor pusillus TaxID=4840 RepID=UPI0037449487
MQQHKRYQLVYIREIKEDPVLYLYESVRVKGELIEVATDKAVIEYEGVSLTLNLEYIDTIDYSIGTMIECFGDIINDKQSNEIMLQPRIIRNLDTLDMELHDRVIHVIRSTAL